MNRRVTVALLALLLAAAACGTGDDAVESVIAESTPIPTATTMPTPEGGPAHTPNVQEPTEPRAQPERTEPEPEATAAIPNQPQPGSYVYDLSGSSHTPFDAGPRTYPEGSRLVVELSRDGDTYTLRSQPDEGSAQTTRLRWEPDRVLLTFTSLEVSGMSNLLPGAGSIECHIEPPVEILRFPMSPGPYPTQSFSSRDCSGEAEIEIVAPEEVTDAAGRTWQTWKVEGRTTFSYGASIEGEIQAVTWLATELGTDVRTDITTQGQINRQPFEIHQQTVLRDPPLEKGQG